MVKNFVIIPAYNERTTIVSVLKELKELGHKNIVVVDDGSRDDTYELALKEKDIWVLKHVVNLGKGAALKTGAEFAIKQGAEKMVFMDADLQHKPKDVKKFFNALNKKDIVFGFRQITPGMPFLYRFGNKFLDWLSKTFFHIKIKDSQCGFRGLTKKAYFKVRWESSDYNVETEMAANAGIFKLKHTQIPIDTIYIESYKGTTPYHGLMILIQMIKWRLFKKWQRNS